MAGLPFIFVIWMLQAVATSVFLERLLLKTTAIGAALNIVLNLFLIPATGATAPRWRHWSAKRSR